MGKEGLFCDTVYRIVGWEIDTARNPQEGDCCAVEVEVGGVER